jgi:voltage-gated sodium channel
LATQYNGSEAEYPDSWKAKYPLGAARKNQPQAILASLYFVSFIMLGTMIMLNLFTGVIIGSMEEASAERKEEVREEHLKKKGFLTLHDELTLLGQQLQNISERLKGIELKEEKAEQAPAEAL